MHIFKRNAVICVALLVSNLALAHASGDRTDKHAHNYSQKDNQPVSDHSGIVVPYLPFKSLNATQAAFDHSKPTDNTLVFDYDERATYKIRLRESMSTIVTFPKNEVILDSKLGNTSEFKVRPYGANGRTLAIDPKTPGVDTSLHVFGQSGYVYTFYLRTDTVESKENPNLRVIINDDHILSPQEAIERAKESDDFIALNEPTIPLALGLAMAEEAPKTEEVAVETEVDTDSSDTDSTDNGKAESETKTEVETSTTTETAKIKDDDSNDFLESASPEHFNFDYEIIGSREMDEAWYIRWFTSGPFTSSESIRPLHVYDDGVFTYFKFDSALDTENISNLPAVFRVADGNDVPTNATAFKTIIRVEGVNNQWTLRLGDLYLCIAREESLTPRPTNMSLQTLEANQ
ncbi:TrbG/VirB9 family P-type conjugative transfer protein [Vibrio sp. 10N.261.46.A3]|uniref:TrbG/VirB9 family P-type conjugative transfer protein n=1 Tax=Vibrio sp. 10N.261.46.A3 TaxID=3229658 RepID=UPI00354DF7BD